MDTWVSFSTGTLAPITNSRRVRSVVSEVVLEDVSEDVLVDILADTVVSVLMDMAVGVLGCVKMCARG